MNYIQIDNRETELFSILQKKKEAHSNLIIESKLIEIGDIIFVINGIEYAIIERKTLRDLAASIKDGRYEEQSYRLNGNLLHNHHISYLIEGDLTKWNDKTIPSNTLYSALTSIQYTKGFSVIRTLHLEETAQYICYSFIKLCKTINDKKPLYYFNIATTTSSTNEDEPQNYCSVIKKTKKDNITPDNMGEIILSQIPGISSVTAHVIMEKYKTIPLLMTALRENSKILQDITYVNGKGNSRKINKNTGETIIKYLSI
jgi:ERCC4-type nuclease